MQYGCAGAAQFDILGNSLNIHIYIYIRFHLSVRSLYVVSMYINQSSSALCLINIQFDCIIPFRERPSTYKHLLSTEKSHLHSHCRSCSFVVRQSERKEATKEKRESQSQYFNRTNLFSLNIERQRNRVQCPSRLTNNEKKWVCIYC